MIDLTQCLLIIVKQSDQLNNPDVMFSLDVMGESLLLGSLATPLQGIKTGDDGRYVLYFWEISRLNNNWRRMQTTVAKSSLFGGATLILRWENEGRGIARLQGKAAWNFGFTNE